MHASDDDAARAAALWAESWREAYGGPRWARLHGLDLVAARGPLRVPILRSATNAHSTRYDAAADAALDPATPRRLLRESRSAALSLDYLDEDARLLAAARGWTGVRRRIVPHARVPVIDCRRSHAEWLAARSKRIRLRLRQDGGKLLGGMGAQVALETGDPVANGRLDACLRLEQAGWKGRQRTAILDDPADTAFYTALARRSAAAGLFRLATLRIGDRLIAFEYGILIGRRLLLLKVSYDETLAAVSPGYVLAGEHIRLCCEHPGIDWYDKLGNGMTPAPYKLRFADRVDTLYRVTAYAPGARGTALWLHDEARARAKRLRDRWRERAAA